ncbi:hypothetical protein HK102_008441 [Quaeritorhiza haematococci]|nr:hypothetical protein HK102_008441 [Quaeritorhiza haematococci]
MQLKLEPYTAAVRQWPASGKHIIAHFNSSTDAVVVYQAYNPTIADHAIVHKRLSDAPGFSLTRMSWIKPGFLWMMYRCGWASVGKKNQERVLAIHLKRGAFDDILAHAVITSLGISSQSPAEQDEGHATQEEQQQALEERSRVHRQRLSNASVLLQWDPDHNPDGSKVPARRAVQLGLRGEVLVRFASGMDWVCVEDVTGFAQLQYERAVKTSWEAKGGQDQENRSWESLMIPVERRYEISDAEVASRIDITTPVCL